MNSEPLERKCKIEVPFRAEHTTIFYTWLYLSALLPLSTAKRSHLQHSEDSSAPSYKFPHIPQANSFQRPINHISGFLTAKAPHFGASFQLVLSSLLWYKNLSTYKTREKRNVFYFCFVVGKAWQLGFNPWEQESVTQLLCVCNQEAESCVTLGQPECLKASLPEPAPSI